jgi:hypothetical protein
MVNLVPSFFILSISKQPSISNGNDALPKLEKKLRKLHQML